MGFQFQTKQKQTESGALSALAQTYVGVFTYDKCVAVDKTSVNAVLLSCSLSDVIIEHYGRYSLSILETRLP